MHTTQTMAAQPMSFGSGNAIKLSDYQAQAPANNAAIPTSGGAAGQSPYQVGSVPSSTPPSLNDYLSNNNTLAGQQAQLAQQQSQAQQQADIAWQKIQKYLGQQQARSGLAMGQRGSDFARAQNYHQNNLAGINSDFAARNMALEEKWWQRDLLTQDDARSRIWAAHKGGLYGTTDEFEDMIEGQKGALSERDYDFFKSIVSNMRNNPDQITADKEVKNQQNILQGGIHSDIATSNIVWNSKGVSIGERGRLFTVSLGNGSTLRIRNDGVVTDQSVIDKSKNVPNEQIFGYNNNLYIKNNKGEVYLIKKNDVDYNKLYGMVFV